jgi:ADP-ribose pyrophosphatase YjhB (NUDIX family)
LKPEGPTSDSAKVERSAGGVVLREIGGVTQALVIRDPYLNWGLPKGHLEENETPAQAALREVAEETGLTDLRLGPELVTIDWYFRARGAQIHKFTTFYLMYSDSGDPVPEKGEGISECLWVVLSEADQKITYDNAGEVMKVAQRVVMEGLESE